MKGKTILIVEDEPSIAEVVSLYLERADFKVKLAQDGEEALQILEKKIPDLLILDLMLPEVDGFAITRWLRERSRRSARNHFIATRSTTVQSGRSSTATRPATYCASQASRILKYRPTASPLLLARYPAPMRPRSNISTSISSCPWL